jgi:hypothetical protein
MCARRQCAAVRLVVYGSTRGSVRLSGSVAARGSVRQYVAVRLRQYVVVRTVVCPQ